MATNYPINPRVRALGKARLDIARRAQSPADWQSLWKAPAHDFPFAWGERWKQCIEYRVDDFAAEVGFFIDILGLSVNALDPDYAMFTSPGGDFFFAVVPAGDAPSTPPDAFRLQFMLADIFSTVDELERRGIAFAEPPQPVQPHSELHIATFLTPHGICIDLWGIQPSLRPSLADLEDEDDEDIFLPSAHDDDSNLFAVQDAAPQRTLIRPTRQPQPLPQDESEEDDEDYTDEDEADYTDEDDDALIDSFEEDDSAEDDDDDLTYEDIDPA